MVTMSLPIDASELPVTLEVMRHPLEEVIMTMG